MYNQIRQREIEREPTHGGNMARTSFQAGKVEFHFNRWTVRYRERDYSGRWKTRRKILEGCKDKKDALQAASLVMADVNRSNNNPNPRTEQVGTFREFVEGLWMLYTTNEGLQPSTVYTYDKILQRYLLPKFGDKKLTAITRVDVTMFFARLPKLSASYLRIIYALLSSIFELAVEYDLIENKPTRRKLHKPKHVEREKPILSAPMLKVLIDQVEEDFKLFVLIIAVGALRVGEALALRRFNFDARRQTLSVTHTLWNGQLQTPKTEASNRVLHLPDLLVGLFEAHLAKSEFKGASDFIFHRSDGSPFNQNHVREGVLYKAMEKVGIKREKGRYGFHILRHSAGSIIHARTGDLKLTQKALGHAKVSTTSDIYVHLEEETLKVATELMAGEIFGNCDLPVTESSRMVN